MFVSDTKSTDFYRENADDIVYPPSNSMVVWLNMWFKTNDAASSGDMDLVGSLGSFRTPRMTTKAGINSAVAKYGIA